MDIDEIVSSDHQEKHNGTSNDYEVAYNLKEHHQYEYPKLFNSKTLLELCYSSSPPIKSKGDSQPYLRGCKWSPDGTCCLSVVNNDGVHVTELPRDLYSGSVDSKRKIDVLDPVIHVKESGLVYDFCWYPGMNSTIPESCCWITTRQNAPIQMWDAFDGSLRCSYRGFNAVDEMEPAISVTFNNEGNRIIGGYKKVLRTFDVERPGRDYAEHKINSPASCFAMSGSLLAVGSWNTTISLFSVNEMGNYKSIGKMYGHTGGVTHVKFAPDGIRLVSGARKDHRLLVWDIRYCRTPLNVLSRAVDTNQRVYFDISPCGKYLVSGGTDGLVKVWDANKVNWHSSLDVTDEDKYNVSYTISTGHCHFKDPLAVTPDEKIDEIEMDQDQCITDMKYSDEAENSLVFWWTGDIDL
ncbi:Telomerase Cajal body protein 1 [Papilio xuthus]|uniref:WD repeat-containing protein 79 n=1 Tax=Papilio xuthus TaxID=66420 RepID=A0A194PMY0_PAPXU|nr:Telomerase Cajal body protein 1 [Papilio xuthus]